MTGELAKKGRATLLPPEIALYSVRDARRTLGMGKTKLFALIKSGALPTHKVGARTVIRRDDLEALIDRLTGPAADL